MKPRRADKVGVRIAAAMEGRPAAKGPKLFYYEIVREMLGQSA